LAYSQLQLPASIAVHPAVYEFAIAIGLLRARRITGDDALAPREVHFMHSRPDDTSSHERLFRCELVFDAPITQLVMTTNAIDALDGFDTIDRSTPQGDAGLHLLDRRTDTLLSGIPQLGGYAEQVLALADCELRTISADHISGRLGVSERTLHRRLAAEGTSYRELIESARKAAALRYLEQPRSLEEVADLLGYASTQSFQRAFRRWTGTSPGSYQRQHARRTG